MITDIAALSPWSESCRQLLEGGRLQAARELIEARLEEDAGDIEAAGLRGVWLAMSGKAPAAERLWRETLEAAKSDPLRLEHYGHLLAELERDDLVAEVADELRALCPDSAIGDYLDGRRAQIRGETALAAEHWQQALVRDPNCRLARMALVRLLEQLGQAEEALDHCEALIERTGESGELDELRGRLLLELGRVAEAQRDLARARERGRPGLEPWLARCLRLQGQSERALEVLSYSRSEQPETAEELVQVLESLGREEEARQKATEASLQWPDRGMLQWLAHRLCSDPVPDRLEPPAVLGGFMSRVRFRHRCHGPRVACMPFSSLGQDGINVALARGLSQILARSLTVFGDARAIPFFKDRAGREPFNFDFSPGYPDILKWGRAAGAQVLVSGESYLFDECVLWLRVTHLESGEEIVAPEIRGPRSSVVSLVERSIRECAQALLRLGAEAPPEVPASFGQQVSPEALLHYLLAAPPPAHSIGRCRALLSAVRASRRFPWAERELSGEIEHLEQEGRQELTLEMLEAFGAARPSDVVLQQQLAKSALRAGNPGLALTAYERCRDADPEADIPTYTLAQILHAEGRVDEAIVQYREAAHGGPQAAEAHGELAGLLIRRGQVEDAIEHWRNALQLQPGLTRYRLRLAEVLLDQGDVSAARHEIATLERSRRPAPPGLSALCRRLEGMMS